MCERITVISRTLNATEPKGSFGYTHVLFFLAYNCNLYILIVRLRWLDWIFWGGYLPSLSINYVAMSKDMRKRLPQLYYIMMKISYDLGFIAIGVAMAT